MTWLTTADDTEIYHKDWAGGDRSSVTFPT